MSVYLQGPFLKVFLSMCEDVNTPRSLSAAMLAKAGEIRQLVSLQVSPESYLDAEDYFKDNIVSEFLRKCDLPDVIPASTLEHECFERLLATERLCARNNLRFSRFLTGHFDQLEDERIFHFLEDVKRRIAGICGPLPSSLEGGFGPGATLTNSARVSTIPDKLESVPTGTRPALALFNALSECAWSRYGGPVSGQRLQQVVRGNRFFTVPKDALKLRGACLSPNVNGFLQKGVGGFLRHRLAKAGIHIGSAGRRTPVPNLAVNDFTSADVHCQIAKEASSSGAYATIDLSDASNTISKKLIELLWPTDWFSLLNDLREPMMERPDGAFQHLEMFSAMGNGFTFEMETITFLAIAQAVSTGFVSVFGDDIIVPTQSCRDVVAALEWCGFQANPRKTFLTGPFRESCGGDFFDGVPVRAHYVKEVPSEPQHWISLANGLRRLARGPSAETRWTYLRRAWFCTLDALPRHIRSLRGPSTLGDLVIHDTSYQCKEEFGIRRVRAYKPLSSPVPLAHWRSDVVYASALYGVPSNGALARNSVSGYAIRWVACP